MSTIDIDNIPWWYPKGARAALVEAHTVVEAHYGDVQRIAGDMSQVKFALERETELHAITADQLARTKEQLDDAVSLAKDGLWRELEDEFQRARAAAGAYERQTQFLARNMEILNAVAHNAVEAAVLRLHKYFAEFIKNKAKKHDGDTAMILGTIPAMSVATGVGGQRVMVDPDGPMARAILRAVANEMQQMPEREPNLKPVPKELEPAELPDTESLTPTPEAQERLERAEPVQDELVDEEE